MRVRILGPIDVVGDDGAVHAIGSRNQRVVLGLLAAAGGEVVGADTLVDALWPDDPPWTALQSLRTYVSRLRHVVGDTLVAEPGGYALRPAVSPATAVPAPTGATVGVAGGVTGGITAAAPDPGVGGPPPEPDGGGGAGGAAGRRADAVVVDAGEFEVLVAEARRTRDAAPRADVLARALGLWRGPALGDMATVDAVRPSAVRLDGLRRAARRERAGALVRAGSVGSVGAAADAVAEAEALVAEEPVDEAAWLVLVEGLRVAGRAPEALRAYQRAVATLAGAGLVPGDALRRAEADAFAGGPRPSRPGRCRSRRRRWSGGTTTSPPSTGCSPSTVS